MLAGEETRLLFIVISGFEHPASCTPLQIQRQQLPQNLLIGQITPAHEFYPLQRSRVAFRQAGQVDGELVLSALPALLTLIVV